MIALTADFQRRFGFDELNFANLFATKVPVGRVHHYQSHRKILRSVVGQKEMVTTSNIDGISGRLTACSSDLRARFMRRRV